MEIHSMVMDVSGKELEVDDMGDDGNESWSEQAPQLKLHMGMAGIFSGTGRWFELLFGPVVGLIRQLVH